MSLAPFALTWRTHHRAGFDLVEGTIVDGKITEASRVIFMPVPESTGAETVVAYALWRGDIVAQRAQKLGQKSCAKFVMTYHQHNI